MPRRLMLAGLLSGMMFAACLHTVAADPPPSAAPAPLDVDALLADPNLQPTARMQLELLRLINARRAESGLHPLALDARLTAAASEHAADMAGRSYCRHRGSDGSSARHRMARHGYPYNNWAGENIVCGRSTPERALAWWLGSPPHRRNLLHGHFTHIGIGVDPNGPYGPMWTLNFAAGASDTVNPSFAAAASPAAAAPPADAATGDGGGG